MVNGILYWPFINAMNFKFVRLEVSKHDNKPTLFVGDVCTACKTQLKHSLLKHTNKQNRPIVGACAGVVWNVYMSSVINAKQHHQQDKEQEQEQELVSGVAIKEAVEEGPQVLAQQATEAQAQQEEEGGKEGPAAAGGIWERWAPAGTLSFPSSINIRFF